MRKKTIVIFLVSMLVIPSIIVSGEQIKEEKTTTSSTMDGPIWKIGTSWTYTIDNFWVNYTYKENNIQLAGRIDDFKLTVAEITETTYIVDISGTVSASYKVTAVMGNIILRFNGVIDPSSNRLKGTIIFDKENLHIKDFDAQIVCFSAVQFFNLPINIPLILKITADATLSTPFPLLDFPLHTLKFWNLPEIDLDTDVNIGGILGIFKVPMTINRHYDWTPLAFCCLYQETITVEGGTYDAWRILSLIGGYYDYYYSDFVGNLIKMEFELPNGGASGELKSYEISIPDNQEKSVQ